MDRIRFICGNWKMNKTVAEAARFAETFRTAYVPRDGVKVAVAAPYLQLACLKTAFAGTQIGVSAQNMHFEDSGAFTGEISAPMLKEIGTEYVILGHSERRQYFGETDASVNRKVRKALSEGIDPILCVGETLAQRDAGQQFSLVEAQIRAGLAEVTAEQLSRVTVAYEPIWAIGTGRTATAEQAQEMCAHIRSVVRSMCKDAADTLLIQYGGSVKPSNAAELLGQPDIDGALVGGASLKPEDFLGIINC